MTAQISTPTFYPGLQYRDADAGMRWLEGGRRFFERRSLERVAPEVAAGRAPVAETAGAPAGGGGDPPPA